jgi:hypothetical protein
MSIAPGRWAWTAAAAVAIGGVTACSIAGPTASGPRETAWIAGLALTIILAARIGQRASAPRRPVPAPRDR